MRFYFLIFGLFISFKVHGTVADDTTKSATRKLLCSLSSSFTNSKNWKGVSFNSLSAALDVDFNRVKINEKSNLLFTAKTELGFTKFIDSTWNKHADKMNCNYVWKNKKRTIDYSYTLSFTTQLFNSYTSYFDPVIKQTKREWAGSILNPATFENGFGLGLSFGKKSMLNVSLATVRLRTEPVIRSQSTTNKNVIGNLPRGKLIFDYGVSTQALTSNELTEKLAVNSTAKFFIKGFQREYFELDVSNKINYTIWKCFQLRADVKLVYDPLVSLKMQYRNELLLGVFYDSAKKLQ